MGLLKGILSLTAKNNKNTKKTGDLLLREAPLKNKHPASMQTTWDPDEGRSVFKNTPQAPGFFSYEKATPHTRGLSNFAAENGFNHRINTDGTITVEMGLSKTNKVKRVKVHDMDQLRDVLGY